MASQGPKRQKELRQEVDERKEKPEIPGSWPAQSEDSWEDDANSKYHAPRVEDLPEEDDCECPK